MLPPSEELQNYGVVDKTIEPDPPENQPLYWSRHRWKFQGEMASGEIQLRFRKLVQNGQTILHSTMSLGLIDALAGVPAFGPNITNEEAAEMGLNPPEILTYQRPLIKQRIAGLQEAWSDERFLHTGSATLHVPPEHLNEGRIVATHDGDDVVLTLKMKDLLPVIGDEHYDVDTGTGKDHRPFHIIDAQHRVAACQHDPHMLSFPVFVTVLPIGASYADAAKLFTDLNVGAEPPRELHQLFQRYTCWMPHHEAKLDYGDPKDIEGPRALVRSANRKAYELALKVAVKKSSPLQGRIQVMELPGRRLGTGTVITTKKFVEFSRTWFKDSKIFKDRPFKEATSYFLCYLWAWEVMVHKTSEVEAWDLSHKNGVADPYITRKFPFESVMGLFPLVWKFVIEASKEPTIEDFGEVLKPLEAIDFGDFKALHKAYELKSQTPKALHAWFSWAIVRYQQTGTLVDAEEVWNPDNRTPALCRPGKGFFSPPDPAIIEAEVEWESIHPGTKMGLWVSPYPNAHLPAVLSVKYLDKDSEVVASHTETGKYVGMGYTHLDHTLHPAVNSVHAMEFQIIIRNQHGEAQLQKMFTLKELRENKDCAIDLGKARSVTDAMLPTPELESTSGEEGDDDENGDKAPQDPTYLTVVKIDDQTLVPPAGPNKYPKPTKKADFLPRRARIVQCPRCSMGFDCNNAQCIGKTVQGYKWMW